MSDRKYRQRGYQDDERNRQPRGPKPQQPPAERAPGRILQDERGPKTPNLMAAHEVFRCARCGNLLSLPVGPLDSCAKCGVDLHSCIQCVSFDTRVERQTTTPPSRSGGTPGESSSSSSARKAFDDLFK